MNFTQNRTHTSVNKDYPHMHRAQPIGHCAALADENTDIYIDVVMTCVH